VGTFVSIVVPTRNRADKLRVCLESLLAQDFPADRYEIVIVDDGSTDRTEDVVNRLIDAGTRVPLTLVRQSPQGPNTARNAGFEVARGDPVCFVDDDVAVPTTWLSTMAEGFGAYPDAPAFAGRVRPRLEHPRRRDCPRHPLVSRLDLGERDLKIPGAVGAAMAIRRNTMASVGPFDPWTTGGDDSEWFDRLSRAGGHLMYLGRATVWHRRTRADLRLSTILRSSFHRGVIAHRYFIRAGRDDIPRLAIRQSRALLRDAARDRCLGALATAVLNAGYAYGMLRHGRVEAPPRPRPGTRVDQ
jgi:glucosyl-dolichyl phosphate glucuronosyltransferase